jgi:serine phosphatase RsbU (regulator of sigma subunit)
MAAVLDYLDGDGNPIPAAEFPVLRALRGERVENVLLQMRVHDGARRAVLISAATFAAEARMLGIAVTFHDVTEREQLLAELRESKALGDALNRINARIDSDLAFDAIMKAVVGESAQALGAVRAALALPEHGGWMGRYLYGAPPEIQSVTIPETERPYIEEVARSAAPVVIADARQDRRLDSDAALRGPVGAVVAMRIELRGELAGVLRYVFAPGPPFVLGRAREDFLRKLAAAVSLGLENARLLAAERHVSETLQTALLAVPHAVHGVTCGTLYRSASSPVRVGGDFYDLFDLPDGQAAAVIGDVSGKGLEAAAATALVRNTIRAYAQEGHGPSALLRMTNAVVLGATPPETFVTVFFGVLDTRTGELVYCSAGHPRPMLKRRDGPVEVLPTRSAVVGAFDAAQFVDDRTRLEPGDVLLLYTDGVTEAHCLEGGLLGEERLADFLGRLPHTTAGKLPDAVFGRVLECTGGRLSDDLAMLSVALEQDGGM